jgi:hypothetical protein
MLTGRVGLSFRVSLLGTTMVYGMLRLRGVPDACYRSFVCGSESPLLQ